MSPEVQFGSLRVVALAAFAIPLLLALIPGRSIPVIVGEVGAGILLGESGLGWVTVGPWLEFLFLFGLAFPLFLAGLEIDFPASAGVARTGARGPCFARPSVSRFSGWARGWGSRSRSPSPSGSPGSSRARRSLPSSSTSTSLGVVLTVLKERGLLGEPHGQLVIVSAAVADFGRLCSSPFCFRPTRAPPAPRPFSSDSSRSLGSCCSPASARPPVRRQSAHSSSA